jgi:polyphosphate kinase
LQFFSEAAVDPDVEEIYVTFYRMAKDSVIGEALISAANNGKKVVVFMEVKARFDEENNLLWSTRMKNAGIKIIYSIPGLKVHAKVALVRKRERSYGFFGTGNLNEKTAKTYCDYGILTSDEGMTSELLQVFKYLYKKREPVGFKDLIVSQFNAIPALTALIDRETAIAREGRTARLIVKVNNLEEQSMIAKLYEAAQAGVEVIILARSICCLVPGTFGIRVVRLVDRYLEHARIFYFHNGGNEEIYLGSSDWMTRNLHHRVEVTFPVKDSALREEIKTILHLQLDDNTNAVVLDKDMQNIQVAVAEPVVNAQQETYDRVKAWKS